MFWLLVALTLLGSSYCEVVSLTDANFDATVAKGRWFVKFFAPWCGHCKRMAPDWIELSTKLPTSVANVAEVDCPANPITCERFDVHGYPSLKMLSKSEGFVVPYEGDRKPAALEAFARSDLSSNRVVFPSAEEAMRAIEEQNRVRRSDGQVANLSNADFFDFVESSRLPVFVAFTMPWCGHCQKLKPMWAQVAQELKGKAVVAEVDVQSSRQLGERFMVRGYPSIFLIKGRKYYECHVDREVANFITFLESGYKEADWSRMPMRKYDMEYFLRDLLHEWSGKLGVRHWGEEAKRWQDSHYATSFIVWYLLSCIVGIVLGMSSGVVVSKLIF